MPWLIIEPQNRTMTIAEICKKEGIDECFREKNSKPYQQASIANGNFVGNGFYAVQKPETINESKVLAAQHVATDTWTQGTKAVRDLLELGDGRIRISPDDIKEVC
jgi:hypothetical protein